MAQVMEAARQLRLGQSRAIGMILLDMRDPFFAALALGAENRARELGHAVVLGNGDVEGDREAAHLDLFEEQRPRGVLISPLGDVEERIGRLKERGAAAVIVDSQGPADVISVSVDDVVGGRLVGRHLAEAGRRHVAFASGPPWTRQVQDRVTGLQRALEGEGGGAVEFVTATSMTIAEGRRRGQSPAARSASRRPDAVFASNDPLALGVRQALVAGGLRVPAEVAVVGCNETDSASAAPVPVSPARQPAARIGDTAADLLIQGTEGSGLGGHHAVFEPDLIVRESSASPALAP